MPKNLSKIFLLLLSTSVAFFICFCNILNHSLNYYAGLSVEEVELLGDRGGSHMPDLGFHITLQPWLVGVVLAICVICIVLICVLVHIKHKKAREIMQQINADRAETKQNNDEIENNQNKKLTENILENEDTTNLAENIKGKEDSYLSEDIS